jgi:hypothetical protein
MDSKTGKSHVHSSAFNFSLPNSEGCANSSRKRFRFARNRIIFYKVVWKVTRATVKPDFIGFDTSRMSEPFILLNVQSRTQTGENTII